MLIENRNSFLRKFDFVREEYSNGIVNKMHHDYGNVSTSSKLAVHYPEPLLKRDTLQPETHTHACAHAYTYIHLSDFFYISKSILIFMFILKFFFLLQDLKIQHKHSHTQLVSFHRCRLHEA